MECRLMQIVPVSARQLGLYVIDPDRLRAMGRMGGPISWRERQVTCWTGGARSHSQARSQEA